MAKARKKSVGAKFRPQTDLVRTYEANGVVFEEEIFPSVIAEAVFRNNAISFDWQLSNGEVETVKLTTLDGVSFLGHSIHSKGTTRESTAQVNADLYSNQKGHVLIGKSEYDDGREELWIVRFCNEHRVRA